MQQDLWLFRFLCELCENCPWGQLVDKDIKLFQVTTIPITTAVMNNTKAHLGQSIQEWTK